MGRIRSLPAHVVNQIAAGEVVDRPSAVVKELVENAIDAGARRIEVSLLEGGKARIEVADDGIGMDAEDVAAAFGSHATSKLSEVGDLDHIASLGFRGEALASIGSVARASILSRPRDAEEGTFIEDREGALGSARPAAAAPGTVVVVEGLFAGVPARRKFLRAAATEFGHVADAMDRFALAYPEVAFRLVHEGRTSLAVPAPEARRARIARVHGAELAGALLEARSAPESALLVEAYLSPPGLSRADTRLQQTFLNGRHVRDRTVQHAVREAYRDLVPPGDRQPIVFLFLACDPERVDVNVHPTKAEVRWRDPSLVHETVRRALRATLEGARPGVPIPVEGAGGPRASAVRAAEFAFTHGVGTGTEPSMRAPAPWDATTAAWERAGAGAADAARGEETSPAGASCAGHAHPAGDPNPQGLRPLGQALGTYLVFEGRDTLVLVDQHALHERVLFDQISARLREGSLEVQHLLVPTVVSLSVADVARLEEERELLARLGWEVEPFGHGSVAVRALPAVLRHPDPEATLHEILGLLESGRREGLDRAALLSSVVDRLACRAAVMAGDALHPEEALALLRQAEALNHAHSCPHGRPTRLVLARADLERWFHR